MITELTVFKGLWMNKCVGQQQNVERTMVSSARETNLPPLGWH